MPRLIPIAAVAVLFGAAAPVASQLPLCPKDEGLKSQKTERTILVSTGLDTFSTVSKLGSGFVLKARTRRAEVLKRWIAGKRVDEIAAETGYKVPKVIRTIVKYKAAVESHCSRISDLEYPGFEESEKKD